MQVMQKHQVFRLVYSSSATVYGEPTQIPIPETCRLAPESCYGRTKMMSELIIKDVCDSKPTEWKAISLRYFNPAGAHPSGEIGEDPKGKPGNLLPLLAQMAVGKYAGELQIFGNDYPTPDGTCVRDYIHGTLIMMTVSSLCLELTLRYVSSDGFGSRTRHRSRRSRAGVNIRVYKRCRTRRSIQSVQFGQRSRYECTRNGRSDEIRVRVQLSV